MKQLMIIFFLAFTISFLNVKNIFAQLEPNNPDTIENKIRNQFIKAVDAAIGNDNTLYQSYYAPSVTAITETGTFFGAEAMNDICRPLLQFYKDGTIQVVTNQITVERSNIATQSVEIITIYTDTSRGISIDNHNPVDKHMSMSIGWLRENDGIWKINSLDRKLWRKEDD